jgi:L-iditol 2-dehydrogenase
MGAEHVVRADEDVPGFVKKVNQGRLADRVMVCAGALTAAQQAICSVDRGGTVVFFAVPNPGQTMTIDFNPFWRNDVSLKTSYGAAPIDNAQALELIRARNVDTGDMITHRFGLKDIGQAFQTALKGNECIKVVITPHGNQV